MRAGSVMVAAAAGVVIVTAWWGQHNTPQPTAPSPAAAVSTTVTPSRGPSAGAPSSATTNSPSAPVTTSSAAPGTTRTPPARPPASTTNAVPTLPPLTRRAPAQAAAFMRAFARPPGGGPALYAWWATVKPFLTATARTTYHDQDPEKVAFTHVTGSPAVTSTGTHHGHPYAVVAVPTDHGTWAVTVVTNTYDQLLISRFTPAPKK